MVLSLDGSGVQAVIQTFLGFVSDDGIGMRRGAQPSAYSQPPAAPFLAHAQLERAPTVADSLMAVRALLLLYQQLPTLRARSGKCGGELCTPELGSN